MFFVEIFLLQHIADKRILKKNFQASRLSFLYRTQLKKNSWCYSMHYAPEWASKF